MERGPAPVSPRRLPKYCSEFRDRHGRMRVRFRRKGFETYYFAAIPWSAEFMSEYQACLAGEVAPKVRPGANRARPGSFDALIAGYLQSPEFIGLAPKTKPGTVRPSNGFALPMGTSASRPSNAGTSRPSSLPWPTAPQRLTTCSTG